jgi:hypothetical protein
MDLWKLRSILEERALYFSTAASQMDKLEGMLPLYAKMNRAQRLAHLPVERQGYALHNQDVSDQVSTHEIILSCWHVNDNENPRMWDEYLESSESEGGCYSDFFRSINE